MLPDCLIPLTISLVAAWLCLSTDTRTFDGILSIFAAIVGIISLIWFIMVAPWMITLGLVLMVMILGKLYLRNTFRLLS